MLTNKEKSKMVVIWENSGTKEAFELMEEHFVEGGWTETEE